VIGQLCRVAKSNVRLYSVDPTTEGFQRSGAWFRRIKIEEVTLLISTPVTSNHCCVLTRYGLGWLRHDSLTLLKTFDEFIGS